ncbi:MAG TPA: DUF2189 domain-containing protein [Beijerinckiaceae bacterium]|nr:DUF2189 domain-containing protein [Beijerinckiaceae bacterium]
MTQLDIIMPVQPTSALPEVRRISLSDVKAALAEGLDDFWVMPTHVVFLGLIYAIVGFLLCNVTYDYDGIPLLYPIATGFALVGPIAGLWLFELSRRREAGMDTSWRHAFDILHSPSLPAIAALVLLLVGIFALWIACAQSIYQATIGYRTFDSIWDFLGAVVGTPQGHRLILFGNVVGLLFAIVAATLSVVSFPLLLDRNVGFAAAILTSIKAVVRNPVVMAVWGLIVAIALALASIPFFLGLAIAMPVLGHATWHLYRRLVVPDFAPRPLYTAAHRRRYAAEFPASIFFASSDEDDES